MFDCPVQGPGTHKKKRYDGKQVRASRAGAMGHRRKVVGRGKKAWKSQDLSGKYEKHRMQWQSSGQASGYWLDANQ